MAQKTGDKALGRFFIENKSKDFLVPFLDFDVEKETDELVDRLNFKSDNNEKLEIGDEVVLRDSANQNGTEREELEAKFDSNGTFSSSPTSFSFDVGSADGFFSLVGFEPQNDGTADVTIKDSASNVIAQKTGISVTKNDLNQVEFSESDYSRDLNSGETITIEISGVAIFQNDASIDKDFFDTTTDPAPVPKRDVAKPGAAIEFTAKNQPLKRFGGFITKKEETEQEWKLEADEYIKETVDKNVKKVYKNKSPEFILEDLIERETSIEFFAPVASGVTLDKYIAEGPIEETINDMTDILDWQLRTTPKREAFLEPIGRIDSGITLEHGKNAYVQNKTTKDDNFLNTVELRAGRTSYKREQTFSGDGSTTTFDLQEVPTGNVEVFVDGTRQNGGISEDLQSGDDFFISKEEQELIFDTAPASGTNNINIDYTYEVPILVEAQASNAQIPPSKREIGTTIKRKWIRTFDDARQYAKEWIQNKARLLGTAEIIIPVDQDPTIGYQAEVIDPRKNLSGDLTVKRKELQSDGNVRLEMGEKNFNSIDWRYNVQKRIKKIEQNQTTNEVFSNFVSVANDLNIDFSLDITIKKREVNDSFILGNSQTGVLGEDELGDRRGAMIWGNSTFGVWGTSQWGGSTGQKVTVVQTS